MGISVDSQSTNSYVNIADVTNTPGILLYGGIMNDGPYTICVKTTVNDLFGNDDQTSTSVITPGVYWSVDSLINIGTANPPYGRIRVDVKSLLSNLHGNFRARFITAGS